MKKIGFIAILTAFCILVAAFSVNAFALEEIDFVPQLKAGKLYGISLESTEAHVRTAYYPKNIEIRDKSGNLLSEGDGTYIGTGFTVKIDGVNYATVVMGDVDGNGRSEAADYLMTKRAVLGYVQLGSLAVEAAGGSSKGEIRPINYMMIKRAFFGTYDINYKYSCDPYVPEVSDETSENTGTGNNWN